MTLVEDWLPRARAAFVVFHVTAITLAALPSPAGGMSRTAWKDPTVQTEFSAWNQRLNAWFGLAWAPQEFEQHAWDLAVAVIDVRKTLLAPFDPYYDAVGTGQAWRMFVAPQTHPARLHIEIERGGQFETIYLEGRDERWGTRWLHHDRLRASRFRYAWPQYKSNWKQFGQWIARKIAHDYPDATTARVSWRRYRSLSPEQVLAGEKAQEKIEGKLQFELAELR
jgi:hypothetical protein